MNTSDEKVVVSRRLLPLLRRQVQVKIPDGHYMVDPRLQIITSDDRDVVLNVPTNGFNYFDYNSQNKITCWKTTKGQQPFTDDGRWKKEGRPIS